MATDIPDVYNEIYFIENQFEKQIENQHENEISAELRQNRTLDFCFMPIISETFVSNSPQVIAIPNNSDEKSLLCEVFHNDELLFNELLFKLSPSTPNITYIFIVPGTYKFFFKNMNHIDHILLLTINVLEPHLTLLYYKHGYTPINTLKLLEVVENRNHYEIRAKTNLCLYIKKVDMDINLCTNDIIIIPYTMVNKNPKRLSCKNILTRSININNGKYEVTLKFASYNERLYSNFLWLMIKTKNSNIKPLRFPDEYSFLTIVG
jgi:hypothetical protein